MYEEPQYNKEFTGTGQHERGQNKVITYPFGKYEIKVELDESNRFLAVIEVKVNKDFMLMEQRLRNRCSHEVDDYYAGDQGL